METEQAQGQSRMYDGIASLRRKHFAFVESVKFLP